jgi:hypothetical protein
MSQHSCAPSSTSNDFPDPQRIIETAYCSELRTMILGASEVAQLVTALAARHRSLGSTLGTHMVEREPSPEGYPPVFFYVHWAYGHTETDGWSGDFHEWTPSEHLLLTQAWPNQRLQSFTHNCGWMQKPSILVWVWMLTMCGEKMSTIDFDLLTSMA